MKRIALTAMFVSVLAGACDPVGATPQPVAFRPGEGGHSGGVYLNTNAIGQNAFSELDLNGNVYHGVRLDAVKLKRPLDLWVTLDEVWSHEGELVGVHNGIIYRGDDFLGSVWKLTFVSPGGVTTPETMWVEHYAAAGGHRYTFKYKDPYDQLKYICEPDVNGERTAVALPDINVHSLTGDVSARADTLYLGCTSGAVGKAATWGYTPWTIGVADFEAAIRVVRADYCGDGASWTVPGTSLQVEDVWSINAFADPTAPTEAIWGADGALCIGDPRLAEHDGAVECGGVAIPACAPGATAAETAGGLLGSKHAGT